jgi:hypothetical protein
MKYRRSARCSASPARPVRVHRKLKELREEYRMVATPGRAAEVKMAEQIPELLAGTLSRPTRADCASTRLAGCAEETQAMERLWQASASCPTRPDLSRRFAVRSRGDRVG